MAWSASSCPARDLCRVAVGLVGRAHVRLAKLFPSTVWFWTDGAIPWAKSMLASSAGGAPGGDG